MVIGMTMTDVHCPNCGHHLFKADLGEMHAPREYSDATPLVDATASAIADFLYGQDRVIRSPYSKALQGDVISELNAWLRARGDGELSNKAIGRGMAALGFEVAKSQGQRFYRGLYLRAETS